MRGGEAEGLESPRAGGPVDGDRARRKQAHGTKRDSAVHAVCPGGSGRSLLSQGLRLHLGSVHYVENRGHTGLRACPRPFRCPGRRLPSAASETGYRHTSVAPSQDLSCHLGASKAEVLPSVRVCAMASCSRQALGQPGPGFGGAASYSASLPPAWQSSVSLAWLLSSLH